ncbi:Copper chaperone [Klebsormidium nitens]|uniref:Copper chaperone n=1 Tax=Klebsormidium nitens TaxID=105231 RepID=A0A1Y1I5N6_KLENI|nr:Copper chaperone [Klebsormidium nitens]|eukprot:GAQ86274.1 Copper chaperone [Klebsormidium nitens]
MPQTVELKVGMTCGGCVGAVERVLKKTEGVQSYNVDLQQQKVTVVGDLDPQMVLEKVAKTGKPTSFWTN